MHKKNIFGFTMVELLIVMAIIGILAALSGFALQGARESGRDARRKSDLESIRSALEIYKADCNQYPPNSRVTFGNALTGPGGSCGSNNYMSEIPNDPNSAWTYEYWQLNSGANYDLCTVLEAKNITAEGSCTICGDGGGGCDYRVQAP